MVLYVAVCVAPTIDVTVTATVTLLDAVVTTLYLQEPTSKLASGMLNTYDLRIWSKVTTALAASKTTPLGDVTLGVIASFV